MISADATSTYEDTCVFCRKFLLQQGLQWYDTELWSNGDLVAIPALGGLAEGLILLLTRHHFHSMAAAELRIQPAVATAKAVVRSVLKRVYGAVTMFEHGAAATGGGGSCIDHAHFHFLPFVPKLTSILIDRHKLILVRDNALSALASTSYLLVEDDGERTYAAPVGPIPGQYIRRVAAELLGRADEWDFALYPGYEQMRSTIDRLQPCFARI